MVGGLVDICYLVKLKFLLLRSISTFSELTFLDLLMKFLNSCLLFVWLTLGCVSWPLQADPVTKLKARKPAI